jgi:hypothetical protein
MFANILTFGGMESENFHSQSHLFHRITFFFFPASDTSDNKDVAQQRKCIGKRGSIKCRLF